MKTMTKKKLAIRFGIIEAVYWSIFATFAAYITAFGLSRGYAQSTVSIMVSIYMTGAFTGQFVWGSVCDKLRTNKKVFLFGLGIACFLQLGMYFFKNPIVFSVLYGLFGFMLGPMGSILETWMLKCINYDGMLYGRSRSAGSAGYAVVILIMGFLIGKFGFYLMPICSTVFIIITFIISLLTQDSPVEEGARTSISLKDIMSIMRIPIYLLIIVMMFFIGLAIAPINNLKIMVLKSVGGGVAIQGVDSFIGCISQFTLFFFSGAFTAIPAKKRLFGCSIMIFLAIGINLIATVPWMVIMGTVILFGAYSLLIPAAREVVRVHIEYKYQTTANGLVDAFYGSLAGTISLLYAGTLADTISVKFMIFVSMIIAFIPISIISIVILRGRTNRKKVRSMS
ncbi:MFS transporter [Anaerocolumna sp. MB42-C2]|uniref:MFS transporter n=1 Tax=Anaerocolumna sp. MB42-C2 TaxID=3070997 RepID=UPI0027E041AD|nr:MFS transporter [Anaerocolumna sp. MB42-C2]WMJ89100.1 MFS transporter [Anaerocolumna sp. MB42-C2]